MNKEERIQKFLHRVQIEDLSPLYLENLIQMARKEDLEGEGLSVRPDTVGDVTSAVLNRDGVGRGRLNARENQVVCGIPWVPMILNAYETRLEFVPSAKDGASVATGDSLGIITGPVTTLLMAERVLLNFLQFLSGIATETRKYVDALAQSSTRLLDTRKTTLGYRMLQKYAVACGGGYNHRLGLFDRVTLKDNHLAANDSQSGEPLTELVNRSKEQNPNLLIEVEVDHLEQIPAVLKAGPDKIMLDNFSIEELQQAVALIGDQACTEATGGITLETLPELGNLGLDFISTGALVHKASWVDIGLDWK